MIYCRQHSTLLSNITETKRGRSLPPTNNATLFQSNYKVLHTTNETLSRCNTRLSGFGGLEDACWPLSTQVRGFKPGRSRRIFQGEKIPSTPSLGGEVKPAVPCRRFAACKRTLNVTWKSEFRQNSRLLFLAHESSTSRLDLSRLVGRGDIWRRQWEPLGKQGVQ
jgi:hypothetical protein